MIWKYIETHQQKVRWVKHMFYSEKDRFSICGTGVQWYSPEEWKTDEKGLAERRECGRCLRIRKRSVAIGGN
jgi:hypothetical protein